MKVNLDIHIRLATLKDLTDILEIEKECFKEPWTEPIFRMILRSHPLDDDRQTSHNFYVCELLHKIVGYTIWENEYFAIASDQRRKGFGRMLIEFAFKKIREGRINDCYLEVRENNLPAIRLYESVGMSYRKRLKNYYFNEDGLVYFRKL